MSSATIMSAHTAPNNYSPVDVMERQEYGVQKSRKATSTGGGRAWSEDEEVYLLQTRLQKMPYKHIAAHLKKTELACRLHYHQLSHGSNRRKRNNSATSSASSTQSPVISSAMSSPMTEAAHMRPGTPPAYAYSPQSNQIQLPSASTLLPRSNSNSPSRTMSHPVAILPKPTPTRRPLDPSAMPPLRLDCGTVAQNMNIANIDRDRLRHIYEAHRNSFWSVIAAEYGGGVSPLQLEDTWKRGMATVSPPTPCISPDTAHVNSSISYHNYCPPPIQQYPLAPVPEAKACATRISALLGIDANPRSPKERELIKQMEERRGSREMHMAGVEATS